MDARSMGRSKKNLRRISETVTVHNLQRLADMDKTSPGRVVDKLVRDRMSEPATRAPEFEQMEMLDENRPN